MRCRRPPSNKTEVPMAAPVLSVREVSMRFGGIVALSAITFDMAPGAGALSAIVALMLMVLSGV